MSDQRITVAVRIRPTIGKEKYEPVCARKADDGQTIIIKPEHDNAAYLNNNQNIAFQFDFVFDAEDQQQAVYEEGVQELVDHSLSGFNSTVFTYGQTGSGKTFTILGNVQDIVANHNRAVQEQRERASDNIHIPLTSGAGMFLRVFEDLFTYKDTMKDKVHILIALSALELYVEDVMDLLSKNKKKLKLRETPEETITMGITLVEVHNMMDVIQNFEIANSFRSVTATKMNDTSSRSHAIFFIDIFQIPREITENNQTRLNPSFERPPSFASLLDENNNLVMTSPTTMGVQGLVRSRMALVDLAGSERVKKSGVTGQAMTEAQAINKSLSTLGTVINAMYTQQQHIPFRESKLTKLLKHSLVDTRSKLLLIGQVAPPTASAQESLGTLRFCDRVKGLKAGQVLGFANPQDEENYLLSVKRNEELVAEMRILYAEYYFEPVGVLRRAVSQQVPLETMRQQMAQRLLAPPTPAEKIEAREQELLRAAEAEEAQKRDAAVEQFVLQMNGLIEEYEQVATAAKQAKKQAKKEREQQEAAQEELVHEAKKAKKHRVKLEEAVKESKLQIAHLRDQEQELTAEIQQVRESKVVLGDDDFAGLGMDGAGSSKPLNPLMRGPTEEAIHGLLENFHNHAIEQSGLYSMYVTRLAATGKQRAQVRRMKLMSSDLVTQGTLLFDILDFLVERAVDIAEGRAPANSKWSWHDVDGLSRQLLEAQQMYPPLLPSEDQLTPTYYSKASEPVPETFHTHTFLSSDESDDENSHHAAESRRPRKKGTGSISINEVGGLESSAGPEAEPEEDTPSKKKKPRRKSSDWTAGELTKEQTSPVPPPLLTEDSVPNVPETVVARRKLSEEQEEDSPKHKKKKKKDTLVTSAPVETGSPEAPSSPMSPVVEEAPRKKKKSKKGKDESEDSDDDKKDKKKKKESETKTKNAVLEGSSDDDDDDDESSSADEAEEAKKREEELTREERDSIYLQQVYDSPTLIQDLVKFLRGGTTMLKHGRSGKPHRRFFWVSTARGKRELLWTEPDSRKSDRSSVQLSAVSYIQLGSFSKVFRRFPVPPSDPEFFRCFTIGLKKGGRTVDVVAKNMADYEAWVVGLAHLVGVDPEWGGKLDVTREKGFENLSFFESSLCESNYIYPLQYLELKKEVQKRAARTIEVLQECGNDKKAAAKILGGIHPPDVNAQGAVYLTKGELRFLCPRLNFDIFRISRIWMLFNQLGLVFDDHFAPATAFGVTRRE